ncbi:MAG: hypothetical protein HKN92_05450 [Chitinophagales bacterium]|nr:hypothetical protein [Chitinophagales bacterium]
MKANKKNYGKDKWFFTIKSIPNNITISRSTKDAASLAFHQYKAVGKQIEWLGKWNGKKFTETAPPTA